MHAGVDYWPLQWYKEIVQYCLYILNLCINTVGLTNNVCVHVDVRDVCVCVSAKKLECGLQNKLVKVTMWFSKPLNERLCVCV